MVQLPVPHAHVTGGRQGPRLFGDALVALHPTSTLQDPVPRCVTLLELPRPGSGFGDAQRFPFRADDVGRVQVQGLLGLVGQRPQTAHRLAIVVQLRGACRHSTTACSRIRAWLACAWALRISSQPAWSWLRSDTPRPSPPSSHGCWGCSPRA